MPVLDTSCLSGVGEPSRVTPARVVEDRGCDMYNVCVCVFAMATANLNVFAAMACVYSINYIYNREDSKGINST